MKSRPNSIPNGFIDSHSHLFSPRVAANVKKRQGLVTRLKLQADRVDHRLGPEPLKKALERERAACLLLPTAQARDVARVNREARDAVRGIDVFYTAATLHPGYPANREELESFISHGIRGIKLCSFSQGFSLDAPETLALFDLIQSFNQSRDTRFFVILDTLYRAHQYFGTHPDHDTRPESLGRMVRSFPGIDFIAAHMGGLAAPFEQIRDHLVPADNLYLDTSNAAHILSEEEFIFLLKRQGPSRVVFGTDWPWFDQEGEIPLIRHLLARAGFDAREADQVWSGNIARLLGL